MPAIKGKISDIPQIVIDLPTMPAEEYLPKFAGCITPKALAAAQRMAEKPWQVKVPRNLLVKLYRMTGGFSKAVLKKPSYWERGNFKILENFLNVAKSEESIVALPIDGKGDNIQNRKLWLVFYLSKNKLTGNRFVGPSTYIFYKNFLIADFFVRYNDKYEGWNSPNRVFNLAKEGFTISRQDFVNLLWDRWVY